MQEAIWSLKADATAGLKTSFSFRYVFPQTASVAASVDEVTLTEQKHNQWDAGSCVHSQPNDHVRDNEEQPQGATSTSTHTQPDSPRRTCTAGSSLRVWPQSRSLPQLLRAKSFQISCPWILWSSLLRSGKDRGDKIINQQSKFVT